MASLPYLVRKLFAFILGKVPVPVMTLGVDADGFVVLNRVKKFAFGALRGPFLLADGTMHGKSDEDFGHGTLLPNSVGWAYSVSVNDGGSTSRYTEQVDGGAGATTSWNWIYGEDRRLESNRNVDRVMRTSLILPVVLDRAIPECRYLGVRAPIESGETESSAILLFESL